MGYRNYRHSAGLSLSLAISVDATRRGVFKGGEEFSRRILANSTGSTLHVPGNRVTSFDCGRSWRLDSPFWYRMDGGIVEMLREMT
jgi:hypothetical protein